MTIVPLGAELPPIEAVPTTLCGSVCCANATLGTAIASAITANKTVTVILVIEHFPLPTALLADPWQGLQVSLYSF
jgi:hypothetical protein